MTTNGGLGELLLQLDEELDERAALGNGAGVFRFAFGVKTALIADADGAAVEGATVSAHLIQSAVLSDRAILPDVVVITYVDKTTLQVVVLQLLWGVVTVLTRGGAVNNKITDGVGGHKDAGLNVSEEFVLGGDLVATDGKRECFLDHRSLRLIMLIQFYSATVITVLPCKMLRRKDLQSL